INVAGYFRAELGIGVAARSLLSALDAAGVPYNTLSFDATANRQDYPFADRVSENQAADINIICVNPDQLPLFAEQTGPALRHGRYTIGVWFWEVEDFPRSFHGAFNYVDEIWVASDFMRNAFLKVSPKPVFKFRLPLLTPQVDPSLSRADLNLPDKFVFLFSFDFLSVLERKNPLGLIRAFARAFSNGEGPSLVIKTINGDKRTVGTEKLRHASRGRSDIILLDGYLSSIENNTLTALSDCYVSLHRSEGFGLTIAEAMALGRPTIATGYSGNLEFMTTANSYLVAARRAGVGPEREPYPADTYWAEPDLEAAAKLLRQVYECPEDTQGMARRGAQDIRSLHSPATAGSIIRDRLATIRRRRATAGLGVSTALFEDRIAELEKENARLRGDS
ncbi:MAG TPA: glycosyltransferase, partial [Candidatus Acidoferrum sp.]|nr:glycosyltransferase [Candidatus Acidoferrum sp.]